MIYLDDVQLAASDGSVEVYRRLLHALNAARVALLGQGCLTPEGAEYLALGADFVEPVVLRKPRKR